VHSLGLDSGPGTTPRELGGDLLCRLVLAGGSRRTLERSESIEDGKGFGPQDHLPALPGAGACLRSGWVFVSEVTRRVIALLEQDPDLGEDLGRDQLALARRQIVVDVFQYPAGEWTAGPDQFSRVGNLGLLVIDGLLARQVTVGSYTCAELLGPGDVLQPWLRIGPDESIATEVDWEVAEPMSAALLNRDFCVRAAAWPEVTAAITRRMLQRAHWLAFHLAVCGLRRVDDRLMLVLWHFADRWGSVTSEGTRVNVRLTHDLLAAVVGARRPSVTTALGRLTEARRLRPLPRSRWLLLGEPPAELRRVHDKARRPDLGEVPSDADPSSGGQDAAAL
jgi:hypothetical protein